MQRFIRDVVVLIVGTVVGMLIFDRLKNENFAYENFAEYVPSIEGFERMNIQSPDDVKFSRGTLERI